MESIPLSPPRYQGAWRASCKPLYWALFLLLWIFITITVIFILCPFKHTAKEPCIAKFGPLPSKWQMASPEPLCMNKTSDWKLQILQNGLYLIYGQVAFDTTYKGLAPFAVQLRKNEGAIQILTNNSQIQTVGGPYELHAGDTIDLVFNNEGQVLKNHTYWGILLVANL